jgi:hypothetical protein
MTHEKELTFTEVVARWLKYHYGAHNVEGDEKQVVLPKTSRRPDYVVETPIGKSLAVEVENERVITYESVGQARAYANELSDVRDGEYMPVVIVPSHGGRGRGTDYLSREVEARYVDEDWELPA